MKLQLLIINLPFVKINRYGKQESFRFQSETTKQEEIIWETGGKVKTGKGKQSVEPTGKIAMKWGKMLIANFLRIDCELIASCFIRCVGSVLSIFASEAS